MATRMVLAALLVLAGIPALAGDAGQDRPRPTPTSTDEARAAAAARRAELAQEAEILNQARACNCPQR